MLYWVGWGGVGYRQGRCGGALCFWYCVFAFEFKVIFNRSSLRVRCLQPRLAGASRYACWTADLGACTFADRCLPCTIQFDKIDKIVGFHTLHDSHATQFRDYLIISIYLLYNSLRPRCPVIPFTVSDPLLASLNIAGASIIRLRKRQPFPVEP